MSSHVVVKSLAVIGHQLFTSSEPCICLHLPCSLRKSSLRSDTQTTCPGTQSMACRHEEEAEVMVSWAPFPLNLCSVSPQL